MQSLINLQTKYQSYQNLPLRQETTSSNLDTQYSLDLSVPKFSFEVNFHDLEKYALTVQSADLKFVMLEKALKVSLKDVMVMLKDVENLEDWSEINIPFIECSQNLNKYDLNICNLGVFVLFEIVLSMMKQ